MSQLTAATGLIIDEVFATSQDVFSPYELSILLFLKNRTLRFGKLAEAVPFRHFIAGVCNSEGQRVCTGVGFSEKTIRKTLTDLLAAGWVLRDHHTRRSGADAAPSYYLNLPKFLERVQDKALTLHRAIRNGVAIQVARERLFSYVSMPTRLARRLSKSVTEQIYMILNSRKAAKEEAAEAPSPLKMSRTRAAKLAQGEGSKSATPKENYVLVRKEKIDKSISSAASQPRVRSEIASACKVVSDIQNRFATNRATNAASTVISKQSLQAVMDTLTAQYDGMPRSLFTNETAALFKRRAKEHAITDFKGFLSFVVANWLDLKRRHEFGLSQARKGGAGAAVGQSLSNVPSAHEITFRMPWFVRHYRDHLGGAYRVIVHREQTEREKALLERVTRAETAAAQEKQENANLRRLMRSRPAASPRPASPGSSILGGFNAGRRIREGWDD